MKTKRDPYAKKCKFDPNQYPYSWGGEMMKTHKQQRCPFCTLWTVYVNRSTGYVFSLCEGREAVSVHLKVDRKLAERAKSLAAPKKAVKA